MSILARFITTGDRSGDFSYQFLLFCNITERVITKSKELSFNYSIVLPITCLILIFKLNLNLNSLLVKRQIDIPSPGAVTGGN